MRILHICNSYADNLLYSNLTNGLSKLKHKSDYFYTY